MVTMRLVVLLSFLVLANRSAWAQDILQFAPFAAAAQSGDAIFMARPGGAEVGFLAVEPFESARPVLNAPYSAEAVTTATQILANGNRIDNEVTARVARDSRGRIRQEHQALFLGALVAERQAALVTISDPAAGTYFTLDQERQVAFRARTRPPLGVARGGAPSTATVPNTASGEFNVAVGQGFGRGQGSVIFRGSQAAPPVAVGGEPVTRQLGDKEIEGVRVSGTRTTVTIPAEQIGNQFPIEIVSERWYSPELQVVVMSRRSDPRFGETVYRLINIVRAEPAPGLFEIPPDFRIEPLGSPR